MWTKIKMDRFNWNVCQMCWLWVHCNQMCNAVISVEVRRSRVPKSPIGLPFNGCHEMTVWSQFHCSVPNQRAFQGPQIDTHEQTKICKLSPPTAPQPNLKFPKHWEAQSGFTFRSCCNDAGWVAWHSRHPIVPKGMQTASLCTHSLWIHCGNPHKGRCSIF